MAVEPGRPARYTLRAGEGRLDLNARLGQPLRLTWTGAIACTHCGRATRKSFGQGHCYPCFKKLAQCDTCIMKPELCHFFQGTCREPDWGERHCFQPHVVYLANASGLKVGITRGTHVPTRWLDQGAVQALPILEVDSRQQSGFVEVLFKEQVSDRTNWRAMLKGEAEALDLAGERDRLLDALAGGLANLRERFGDDAIRVVDAPPRTFEYPVLESPRKVVSHNFDKQPEVAGTLLGIKGQYLILDSGVINLRKFTGYEVAVEA
ncbi:DUF2797 domain-containing protein [Halomonas nitroreducens]|uniref:DUF2797 domain-containing protein n=1 Tax=Halomonas nitroreducens TaxID=447425 RepID=A0A3S0J9B5_9GAMM|nr:DUF2797 domain-containing protein [Halomonas nitroreducens]RTR02486.1 DUF2797 domain-containing protein [Halomonas nitroreducens]